MAEYLIKDTTLTGLADKIRVLNGTEETMTPVEMGNTVETYSTEMEAIATEQTGLIEQIMTMLNEKRNVSLIDLLPARTNVAGANQIINGYQGIDASGNVVDGLLILNSCYVSSSEPSASDGMDGDIWLVTEA